MASPFFHGRGYIAALNNSQLTWAKLRSWQICGNARRQPVISLGFIVNGSGFVFRDLLVAK